MIGIIELIPDLSLNIIIDFSIWAIYTIKDLLGHILIVINE
jgi:hypothetical protein